jgi:hypothetical protein
LLDTIFTLGKSDRKKYLAAKARLTDQDKAEALKDTTSPALRPLARTYRRELGDMRNAERDEDYRTAFVKVGRVQTAIKELVETASTCDIQATSALETFRGLSATDLKGKSSASKIRLLKELRSGSAELNSEQKAAQRDIYNSMDLDPAFLNHDAGKRAQIAGAMTNTPQKRAKLRNLKANWKKTPDAGGPTVEEKLQFMRDAIAVQCQALGIDPPPEVLAVDEPRNPDTGLIDNGSFDPNTGKISINTNPESSFHKKMAKALDLALHENSHNYQDHLVKKLEAGTLKQGDPEYEQALMFQANSGLRAYVEGKEDFATYKKQPLEEHAHFNGPQTAKAILKKIQPPTTPLPVPPRTSERS